MSYFNHIIPPSPAQHIRFGQYFFSVPEVLPDVGAGALGFLDSPGLYVVLVYDPNWGPLPYRPLYFGESQRIWGRATRSHENYERWRRAAGTATLYRSFHYMAGSTQVQRQTAESALISQYNTSCNDRLSVSLLGLLKGRTT